MMAVPVLEAIADAIYTFEGDRPMDRAYRNRNPGNLRSSELDHELDGAGYCVFASLLDGYSALLADLKAKVSGGNSHGLSPKSTLLDMVRVYAPEQDGNKPEVYASFIAHRLGIVYDMNVLPLTTFDELFVHMAGQELPHG